VKGFPRFALPAVALAAYASLLLASAPAWPDDWDGVGFVESVTRFDLDRFSPHPPGYPVYVALLRAAAVALRDPMHAAIAVAVASGVAAVAFAGAAAGRAWGTRVGWTAACAVAIAPLAWRATSGVGSEAPALAFACMAAWGISRARVGAPGTDDAKRRAGAAMAIGIGVGLGLGVRASWAPLYVPMLLLAPKGARARAAVTAAIATAAWAVPFVAIVGPSHLVQVSRAHFAGHAERWGGTIVTDAGIWRAALLARDVFVDGLGVDADLIGIVIGCVAALIAIEGAVAWRRARWVGAGAVALALGPYLLWIALGQNLRQQPRHALPLVVALATALAVASLASTRARRASATLLILLAMRTAVDARDRRLVPPPGAQLVDLVRRSPDVSRVAVFGGASVRFFELTELAPRAHAVGSLGDGVVALGRADSLPDRALVTSEVDGLGDPSEHVEPLAVLCRPPRIDRRAPCLTIYQWRPSFLRR
jgi:hypothetical protein